MIRRACEPLSVNVQSSNDVWCPQHNNICGAGVRTRGFVAFDGSAPPFKHPVAADCEYNCSSWAIGIIDNNDYGNEWAYKHACLLRFWRLLFLLHIGGTSSWLFLYSIEYQTLPSDLSPKTLILWWIAISFPCLVLLLCDLLLDKVEVEARCSAHGLDSRSAAENR